MSVQFMRLRPLVATVVSVLFLGAALGLRADQRNGPAIETAVVTTTTNPNQIAIRGSGFGGIPPTVTLDGVPLVLISYSDTLVVAVVPADATAHPGSYRLSLTNNAWHGNSSQQTDTMDVAIGAVGPAGPTGPAGPQGPQGQPGAPGPTGPAGAQGLAGPAGAPGPAGLNWRGAWNSTTIYAPNDAVQFNGSSYVAAVKAAQGIQPDTNAATWNLLAQQGAQGPAGATGAQGSAGPPGAQGPQGLQGATGAQGLPGLQGLPGATGAAGPQGPAGVSGYRQITCPVNIGWTGAGPGDFECSCPSGTKPLSGGFRGPFIGSPGWGALTLVETSPLPDIPGQSGWTYSIRNSTTSTIPATLFVVCANMQ